MRHWIFLPVCLFVAWAGSFSAYAQSNNYWMNQHGNRARLLGGAMIGSAKDLSAVYYNPGALALVEKPEILLAGNVVEFREINGENLIGDEASIGSTRLSAAPSLLAGEISLKQLHINRLAYSLLTRVNNHDSVRSRLQQDQIGDFPNLSFFANDLDARQSIDETWFGLSYARKIRSNVGVGVTSFVAYRSHDFKLQDTAQGLSESGEGAVALETRDLSFAHFRLLWKIGLASEWHRWKLGFSITTPGIGLFGDGVRRIDQTRVSTIPDQGGNTIAQVTTATQEADSAFHSPLSLGFGLARRLGNTYLHFSTEWFAPVSEYKVLDIEPFVSQSTGEVIDAVPYGELDDVLNFAVGVEHQFSDSVHLFGGFNTDFSGTKVGSRANISFTAIDLYHLAGGATFRIGSSYFTLGGNYAFGSTGFRDRQPGQILPDQLSLSFRRITMLIGVSLPY